MVKIKDFTLASKNLGGGGTCPRALQNSRPWTASMVKRKDFNNWRGRRARRANTPDAYGYTIYIYTNSTIKVQ